MSPTRQKLCLDPQHVSPGIATFDDDRVMCPTCGGERLAFKPEDPGLADLMEPDPPPVLCWLAYYSDWSGMAVFAHEIDALRHAVGTSMNVIPLTDGDIRDQINQRYRR